MSSSLKSKGIGKTSQPTGFWTINKQHPLARGLVLCVYPVGGNFYDAVSGQIAHHAGNSRYRKTANNGAPATSLIGLGTSANPPAVFPNQTGLDKITGPHSIFIEGSLEVANTKKFPIKSLASGSGQGAGTALGFDDNTNVLNGVVSQTNDGSGTYTSVYSANQALGSGSTTKTHRVAVALDGASRYIYANGKLSNTAAQTAMPGASTLRRTYMNATFTTTDYEDTSSLALALAWNRPITLAEYQQLYNNPWQIFSAPATNDARFFIAPGQVAQFDTNSVSESSSATVLTNASVTDTVAASDIVYIQGTVISNETATASETSTASNNTPASTSETAATSDSCSVAIQYSLSVSEPTVTISWGVADDYTGGDGVSSALWSTGNGILKWNSVTGRTGNGSGDYSSTFWLAQQGFRFYTTALGFMTAGGQAGFARPTWNGAIGDPNTPGAYYYPTNKGQLHDTGIFADDTPSQPVTIVMDNGGAFNMTFIDLAPIPYYVTSSNFPTNPSYVVLTGTRADNSTVTQTIKLTVAGYATYPVTAMTNVVKVLMNAADSTGTIGGNNKASYYCFSYVVLTPVNTTSESINQSGNYSVATSESSSATEISSSTSVGSLQLVDNISTNDITSGQNVTLGIVSDSNFISDSSSNASGSILQVVETSSASDNAGLSSMMYAQAYDNLFVTDNLIGYNQTFVQITEVSFVSDSLLGNNNMSAQLLEAISASDYSSIISNIVPTIRRGDKLSIKLALPTYSITLDT